jgi:hypothetical protein
MFKNYLMAYLLLVFCFCLPLKAMESVKIDIQDSKYIVSENPTCLEALRELTKNAHTINISYSASENVTSVEDDSKKLASTSLLHPLLSEAHNGQNLNILIITNFTLNNDSFGLIGGVLNLSTLEVDECGFEDVSDFTNLSRLSKLETLRIKNSRFCLEGTDIPFKSFMISIRDLRSLKVLDLTNCSLFPVVRTQKYYGRKKADVALLETYKNWRIQQIQACACMLVANFRGEELLLEDTRLGEIFIDSFTNQLERNAYPQNFIKIDFSKNYIPLSYAVDFAIKFRKRSMEVTFLGNKGESDNCVYSLKDIHDKILEQYFTDLILE